MIASHLSLRPPLFALLTCLALVPSCDSASKDTASSETSESESSTDDTGDTGDTGEMPQNLLVNGYFDEDVSGWTPQLAALSVEEGQLRVETIDQGGPALAWQAVTLEPGKTYRISASFGAATFEGSSQVRVGDEVNLDNLASCFNTEPTKEFTATSSTAIVTCNNVATAEGDFARFDDLELVLVP